ncbi:endonuclease/exonuclease/phosphatase family protein [Mesorhizobium sp. M0145]|uniref:endonuclease/exonuclease/phosphatase family protein n=1 Tax=unclassified Mesorhizobium TaxID=325217 RepID=UPI003334D693
MHRYLQCERRQRPTACAPEVLGESDYDIVCVQESKTSEDNFLSMDHRGGLRRDLARPEILQRCGDPGPNADAALAGGPDDTQSRYIEAEVDGVVVGCLYQPNGNPAPGPKFDYKLRWFDRLINYGQHLLEVGAPSVLCGDYNVVPTQIDAVVPRRWLGDAVNFPECRQAYAKMLEGGWVDGVRRIHPEKGIYTYWNFSYWGGYDRSSGL